VGNANVQVVWFKRDLRIRDHAPLASAAAAGPVLPLYIVEPELWRQADAAPQHWDFIRQAVTELRSSLANCGAPLVVRVGDAVEVLRALRSEVAIQTIWSHEETGNMWTYERDKRVAQWARSNQIDWREQPHDLIVRRLGTRDDWGQIAKARLAQPFVRTPERLTPASCFDATQVPLGTIPETVVTLHAPSKRVAVSEAGERAARVTLDSFLSVRSKGYEKNISSPITAWRGCSRLSAHLTYGTISLREVMLRTRRAAAEQATSRFSLRAFEERLFWRSHFIQKLEDQPSLEHRSYVRSFDGIRLDPQTSELGAQRFEAWATGRTGYPMVDACMRSLLTNGWINFRMRAMLVSFASYDLWLDWRATAPFMARAFVDYEPGIHYPQMQMQSGTTGINTIRIYDPVKQGIDHDPTGSFVRTWVPELANIEGAMVHEPWLRKAELWGAPSDYPDRIVDHAAAVAEAWKHVDRIKSSARRDGTSARVQEKHGSRRPPPQSRRTKVNAKAGSAPSTAARSLFDDVHLQD
jgi:deoxyribodipyrimidine photo-lyase